jgi:hypothetical protein
VSFVLLAGLLAALVALDRLNLSPSPYRIVPPVIGLLVYAIIALAGLAIALTAPAWRRIILLVAGMIALPIAMGAWALVLVGFAVLTIVLARLRQLPIVVRFVVALAAWLVVPVLRVYEFRNNAELQAQTILLAQLWVGMLYAALYMIVERARALPDEKPTLVDDAFYLLAPPRLVMPFFQPLSPREVVLAERPQFPKRLLWRGAGLAGYALVVAVAAHELDSIGRHVAHSIAFAGLLIRFVAHYARAAHAIMLAMAAFRLLGYDVAAGFRYPFLSRTFADFFRRYNHYVRDAVVSLFFMPTLGHLRHKFSRRTASIIAAYTGILIGSLALQDLLIPAGLSLRPFATIHALLRPHRIAGMLIMWSLIVIPNAGLAPRRRAAVPRWRVVLQIALVNAIYFGLWYLQLR